MDPEHDDFLSYIDLEDDPEIIAEGEEALHDALHIIQMHVDPAFSFIMYRFNRIGIKHDELDAVLYIDKDGIPTLGINYRKFTELTPLAQIGLIEHHVGHLMSGHLGNRLGTELREYCEQKHGEKIGRQLYYLTIEAVADSFVTYPGALKDAERPHYDVRKFGLTRWEHTLNVVNTLEQLLDKGRGKQSKGSGQAQHDMDVLAALGNSDFGEDDDDGEQGEGKGAQGGGEGEGKGDAKQDTDGLNDETGGTKVKDILFVKNKKDALMGEDKIRDIIKTALENTETNKQRGYLSGDCSEFIEADEVQPIVPWHQRLNHVITSGISTERRITKRRINRRNPDFGFGRAPQNVTTIAFIIDTSGSMGKKELGKVNAELDSIAQNTEQAIPVIHCDAAVAKCETYRRGMHLEQFFGRGGTDFEPALTYVRDELDEPPDIIVYFTDGYGGALDDDNPIIPPWEALVLWILTPRGMGEEQFRDNITKLGEVIKVEEWDE